MNEYDVFVIGSGMAGMNIANRCAGIISLSEEQAQEQNLDFTVKKNSVPGWFTAKRINEKTYAFKTLVEKGSGKILGAHLIGTHAEKVINLFAMAIKANWTALDIKTMILTYPSASSDIVYMV